MPMSKARRFLLSCLAQFAGGFAIQSSNRLAYAGALIIIWLCSVIAARFIPKTAPAAPTLKVDLNIFRSTYRLLKLLRANETLRRLTVITSMFWLFGAIAMALMPTVVTQQLHGSENIVTLHLTVFAIAIALGSCAAVFLLKGRIVLLPTVAGALLIATAATDTWLRSLFSTKIANHFATTRHIVLFCSTRRKPCNNRFCSLCVFWRLNDCAGICSDSKRSAPYLNARE